MCASTDKVILANASDYRIYVVTDTGSSFSATSYYTGSSSYRPYYGSPAVYDLGGGSFEIYWCGYYYLGHLTWTGSGFSNFWTYYLGSSSYYNTPCIDANGYVFCGSDYDYLRCISPSGSLVWQSPYWYDVMNPTISDDGYVYAMDQNRYLHKVGVP